MLLVVQTLESSLACPPGCCGHPPLLPPALFVTSCQSLQSRAAKYTESKPPLQLIAAVVSICAHKSPARECIHHLIHYTAREQQAEYRTASDKRPHNQPDAPSACRELPCLRCQPALLLCCCCCCWGPSDVAQIEAPSSTQFNLAHADCYPLSSTTYLLVLVLAAPQAGVMAAAHALLPEDPASCQEAEHCCGARHHHPATGAAPDTHIQQAGMKLTSDKRLHTLTWSQVPPHPQYCTTQNELRPEVAASDMQVERAKGSPIQAAYRHTDRQMPHDAASVQYNIQATYALRPAARQLPTQTLPIWSST